LCSGTDVYTVFNDAWAQYDSPGTDHYVLAECDPRANESGGVYACWGAHSDSNRLIQFDTSEFSARGFCCYSSRRLLVEACILAWGSILIAEGTRVAQPIGDC